MKLGLMCAPSLLVLCAACGSDDVVHTDPGDGSGTLYVRANVENDGDAADIEVQVQRNGQDVTDAEVIISSDNGDVIPIYNGDGDYIGRQAGWSGYYRIEVTAGDDWLDGGLEAPDLPELLAPLPHESFDPHDATDGVMVLEWDGDLAMTVDVRTGDFEWQGEDVGSIEVPATMFQDESQEIEIDRQNNIRLEGGAPDSQFVVESRYEASFIVVNPY